MPSSEEENMATEKKKPATAKDNDGHIFVHDFSYEISGEIDKVDELPKICGKCGVSEKKAKKPCPVAGI